MTQQSTCPSCGTPVPNGAIACPKCGTGVATSLIDSKLAATAAMAAHDAPTMQDRTPAPTATADDSHGVTGGLRAQTKMMEALRSATLGDYEIIAELGRGGMAIVYLAHDISLDRKVAIKVMSPAFLGEGAVERFKREARTAGALSHPHIIPIHAVRESGELLYFVMKYVEGRPLDSVIKDQGKLPIPMIVQILSEVAGALSYAHRKGVIHRDVKPPNIMLDDEGWAVVTDFGIAKVAQQQGLTMTGSTVGTPAYMSPEQCSGADVTGRSDQYSLGIVGYELLTGRVPFKAESLMGMFMAHMSDAPSPLREERPDCPPRLAETVDRMMAKSPDDRWSTLDDVVAALATLVQAETREGTRASMMALARVSDGRPRADDFARPVSPSPRNSVRKRHDAAALAETAAPPLTARLRVSRWAWGAAAVAVIGVGAWGAWLATQRAAPSAVAPSAQTTRGAGDIRVASDSQGRSTPSTNAASDKSKVAKAADTSPRDSSTAGGAKVVKPPPVTQIVAAAATPTSTARDSAKTPAAPAPTLAGNSRADSASDPLAGAPTFTEISAGGSTTCGALTNDAGVVCWGAASSTGAKLEGVLFSKLSVGDGHLCGLTPAGEAFCWGANSQGQLGDGTTTERDKPTAVKASQRFTEISVGAGHTCALSADGTAFCWGGNKYGQLGDGSRSNRNRPVLVRSTAGNQGFQALAAGGSHTCGVTRANKAFCWGDGFSGQVGNAMQDFAVEPFAVKTDLSFRTVVAGDRHTCGLTTSGRVYCWGDNKQGQLGNETKDDRNVPDSVITDKVFRAIGAGGQHTCGISTARQLLCWGYNVDGRLGDGTRSTRTVPAVAANGQTFSLVSAGSGHTCALMTTGQAMCWGANARGQLGGGSTSAYSATPVVVKLKGS
jgi:serine/threonine-protein kinase